MNPFAWLVKALKEDYRDTVQDKKVHQKLKKVEAKKKLNQRDELEAKLKQLKSDYFNEKSAYCDALIKKDPAVLSETIEIMRGSLTLKKGFQEGFTPEKMYADSWMRGSIQAKLEERYGNYFLDLEEKYVVPIGGLKKILGY